jgi:hypothetical protein
MLLRRRYRDRAIGLVGAYAVLIGGVIASGSFERAPEVGARKLPLHATEAALDPRKTEKDREDGLERRSGIVC